MMMTSEYLTSSHQLPFLKLGSHSLKAMARRDFGLETMVSFLHRSVATGSSRGISNRWGTYHFE